MLDVSERKSTDPNKTLQQLGMVIAALERSESSLSQSEGSLAEENQVGEEDDVGRFGALFRIGARVAPKLAKIRVPRVRFPSVKLPKVRVPSVKLPRVRFPSFKW